MELINGKTLTLKSNLRLSETSEVVQAVIQGQIKYDTLEIRRSKDLFIEGFLESETFKTFYEKLEVSVTTLICFEKELVYPSYLRKFRFRHLRTLIVEGQQSKLEQIPIEVYQGSNLETVILNYYIIVIDDSPYKRKFEFQNLLNLGILRESLKTLIFVCEIPFEPNALNDIFGFLNYEYLKNDEVIFDCVPLPCGNNCLSIKKIKLEFIKNDGISKVIVKPLKIYDNNTEKCERSCQLKHQVFRNESVTEFFTPCFENKCLLFYRCLFESFPYIKKFYAKNIACDQSILNLLSGLKHLCECQLNFFKININQFPPFPNMKRLKVWFHKINEKDFEAFFQSVPELRDLDVKIYNSTLNYDNYVKLISKHLKDIECLQINCSSHLTEVGLNIIGSNLKKLKHLDIFCTATDTDIKQLFVQLPHLEGIKCNYRNFKRDDSLVLVSKELSTDIFESDTATEMNLQSVTLPEEPLVKIFRYLKRNDQLNCRRVCKSWFNILSTNSKLDRTLDFSSNYLYRNADFVKTFSQTKFQYNRLVFCNTTTFVSNENLTVLWRQVGPSVEEIYVQDDGRPIIGALRSGLSKLHLCNLNSLVFQQFNGFCSMFSEEMEEWTNILRQIKRLSFHSYVNGAYAGVFQLQYYIINLPNLDELYIGVETELISKCLNHFHSPNIKKIFCVIKKNLGLFLENCNRFQQLNCLFILKTTEWKNSELEMISNYFPNLNLLGLQSSTKFQYLMRDHIVDSNIDDIFDENSCANVAKEMFQKLPLLRDIYFSLYKRCDRTYSWSENGPTVSNRFYSPFEGFLKKHSYEI